MRSILLHKMADLLPFQEANSKLNFRVVHKGHIKLQPNWPTRVGGVCSLIGQSIWEEFAA